MNTGEENFKGIAPNPKGSVTVTDLQVRTLPIGRESHIFPGNSADFVLGFACLRRGVPIPDILHGRLFGSVGKDNAIGAERVVALPITEVAAVAQNLPSIGKGVPKSLVHIVPDEAALVHGEFLSQADIAFHTANGVAHVVHIFTEQEGLLGVGFQIFPNSVRPGVHLGFYVGNGIICPIGGYTFIVDHPAGVLSPEEIRHGENIRTCIGFVAAGPEKNCRMVLVPFKHGFRPVKDAGQPLWFVSRQIAFRIALEGAVGFQVGLIDHVDAVPIAHMIPGSLVGVMTGADCVDVIAEENLHGPAHIFFSNGASGVGVPFVAVHAVEHNALPVEKQEPVLDFKPTEADVIGDELHGFAVFIQQSQKNMIEGGRFVAPGLHILEGEHLREEIGSFRMQLQVTVQQPIHLAVNPAIFAFTAELQADFQSACGVVLAKAGLKPQIFQMEPGLCIEEDAPENTAESEEVLIFQPGGTAVLENFHTEPVVCFLYVGCQIKI